MVLFISSCGSDDEVFVPKPIARNHIELPQHEYRKIQNDHTPYSFEYSAEADLLDDTIGIHEEHWKKLIYKNFGSEVDITYKSINGSRERLDSLIRDSYKLVDEHNVKAQGIDYKTITLTNGYPATIFTIKGEVPTTFQFYTHDSTNHFLRCSLYFKTALRNDSLKPVIDFCISDMYHMMNTLEWQ